MQVKKQIYTQKINLSLIKSMVADDINQAFL